VGEASIGLLFRLPGYVNSLRSLANEWVPALNEWLGADRVAQFETSLTDWLNNLPAMTATVTTYIAQSGLTFAQDPETCLVAGMPEAALRNKATEHRVSPEALANVLRSLEGMPPPGSAPGI